MNIENLAKELILKNMTPEQQMAILESVKSSVVQAKEAQKRRIGENVDLVVQALKKIETDIRSRYDELGKTIEKRVSSIKDGRDGADGKNGRDGKDGKPGRDGAKGDKGDAGRDGRDGIDGVDGVSVTSAHIDFDGGLVITLSNGVEINVGEVVAPDLAERIKVITNGGGTSQSVIDTLASLQSQITSLIPSQTGNTGKFLSTNGSVLSWETVIGGLSYQGTWNASTNTPSLASGVGTNGYYYVVDVAGSTNLNGITDWQIGDWLIFNGTIWQKIDNTDLVTSVNGQTGTVVLSTTNVSEGTNQYFTNARARSALSAGTGITYNNTTGQITNSSPDQTVALTGSGTTTITGTYPNFTISSADLYTGTVTGVTGTSPISSSGGTTPAISLASGYGDTQNPYASKTANYVLASPNGTAGVPTFRALVASDVPTLNQNTTGSAATLTTGRTISISGDLSYTSPSFDGSANVTAAGTLATVNANVGSFTYASITVNGKGLITAASSGTAPVTSVTATSPVSSSGGTTPAISLASGYGDTQNPYASKTANYFLASPNGSAGTPSFRAIVAADIPTLNQNTTGTASNVTGTVAIANGGTGQTTANAAFNALAPSQSTNSGKYLTTDGTNTSWATVVSGASVSNDTSTTSNLYPLFSSATTGTPTTIYTSNSKYLYKPSTGELQVNAPVASNGIFVNNTTVASSYTIATNTNGFSVGPVTVSSGISVTISSGQRWVVI